MPMDFNSSNMMTTMARSNSVAASSLRTYRTSNSSSSGGGGMSVNHLTTTTTLQEQQEQNTNYWEIEQSAKTTGDLTEDAAKSEAHDDFNSTQRLRSGFFRSIKRQYPSVQLNGSLIPSDNEESKLKVSGSLQEEPLRVSPQPLHDASSSSSFSTSSALSPAEEDSSSSFISMKRSARRKLNQLRKCDPKQVDIQTGLQWIRLELNEMREQDKSIFLQLAKVYSNLKELKSELKQKNDDEDFEYSCEDFYQLPAWWHGKSTETKISTPHISTTVATAARFNTNSSRSLLNNEHGKLTNFSASDSAQFVRTLSVQNHRRPRRGRSPLPIPLPSTPPVFNF